MNDWSYPTPADIVLYCLLDVPEAVERGVQSLKGEVWMFEEQWEQKTLEEILVQLPDHIEQSSRNVLG